MELSAAVRAGSGSGAPRRRLRGSLDQPHDQGRRREDTSRNPRKAKQSTSRHCRGRRVHAL